MAVASIEEFYQKYSYTLGLQQLLVGRQDGVSLESGDQFCFLEQVPVPLELESQVACVVIPPSCLQDYLVSFCRSQGVALVMTSLNRDSFFLSLKECMAVNYHDSIARHGTFVRVWDQGVMIRGESGSGKSDLALELVDRNHQLVADDQIEFVAREKRLYGRSPNNFQGFIEIRGLGIINLVDLYGEEAVLGECQLDLVVTLGYDEMGEEDRLGGLHGDWQLRGVTVPEVLIPFSRTRNMPLLIETAARVNRMRQKGYDPSAGFHEALALVLGQENA